LIQDLPSAALVVAHAAELDLYAVHTVDAVNEQDKDEDKSDLNSGEMIAEPPIREYVPSCHIVILLLLGSPK
jgi:hypothetical protein